jgi:hypothetical protein
MLTQLLETINKITKTLSGGNGLAKSLSSLMLVVGALGIGKTALGGKITGKFNDFLKGFGTAKDKVKQVGDEAENSGHKVENLSNKGETGASKMASGFGKVGAAIAGVGVGLSLLSSLFEELGMDAAAEAVQNFSSVLIGLGSVMSVVSTIMTVF